MYVCNIGHKVYIKQESDYVQRITVQNSPKFHIILDECEDIHVQWLNIKSPANSPNTNGIHVPKSNNVKIYHSTISTGN